MGKNVVIKILENLKQMVKQKYKAEIKGIFGSYARGQVKKGSDIDILVDFYKDADLFDLVGLALFLERKLKHKVDVVPQSTLRKEIKTNVLKDIVYI